MKLKTLAAACAALLVVACASSSWFGEAETPGQRAFLTAGKYVYAAIPAAKYAQLPSAKAEVVAVLRNLDLTAFNALQGARDALEGGGVEACGRRSVQRPPVSAFAGVSIPRPVAATAVRRCGAPRHGRHRAAARARPCARSRPA